MPATASLTDSPDGAFSFSFPPILVPKLLGRGRRSRVLVDRVAEPGSRSPGTVGSTGCPTVRNRWQRRMGGAGQGRCRSRPGSQGRVDPHRGLETRPRGWPRSVARARWRSMPTTTTARPRRCCWSAVAPVISCSRPEHEPHEVIIDLLHRLWRVPLPQSHRFRPLSEMCDAWADESAAAHARTPVP